MVTSESNRGGCTNTIENVQRRHFFTQGAELQPDGSVRFSIWAPAAKTMHLEIDDSERVTPLETRPDGWHELRTTEAGRGTRYHYVLPDGTRVPDPASRFQPEDLDGRSEVIDPEEYRWTDFDWVGRDWCESVIYELHILSVRKKILPAFRQIKRDAGSYQMSDKGAVIALWKTENKKWVLMANLSDRSVDGFKGSNHERAEVVWHEGPTLAGSTMRPWSVRWSLERTATNERH